MEGGRRGRSFLRPAHEDTCPGRGGKSGEGGHPLPALPAGDRAHLYGRPRCRGALQAVRRPCPDCRQPALSRCRERVQPPRQDAGGGPRPGVPGAVSSPRRRHSPGGHRRGRGLPLPVRRRRIDPRGHVLEPRCRACRGKDPLRLRPYSRPFRPARPPCLFSPGRDGCRGARMVPGTRARPGRGHSGAPAAFVCGQGAGPSRGDRPRGEGGELGGARGARGDEVVEVAVVGAGGGAGEDAGVGVRDEATGGGAASPSRRSTSGTGPEASS